MPALFPSAGLPVLAAWLLAAASSAQAFDFEDVAAQAKKLAAAPYEKPDFKLPKALADLNYDQYRSIRFRTDHATWRAEKLPFELQYFHPGLYYNQVVRINLVENGVARPLRFDPASFDYGGAVADPAALGELGYAGFRIHYALNKPDYKDELAVFAGASYYRVLGQGQAYGISARGLAVDTGLPAGEEFPVFKEFWIERPSPRARELTLYALLDSPRVAGAYRMVLKPGVTTRMEVKARLYLRAGVGTLGVAPLSSMFTFGEDQHWPRDDYRPEVHDSDGLLVQTGAGEWLWRPLINPKRLLITSFATQHPRGFGLMQRDRAFASYEDLESHFERRPSVWIEPRGDWGEGRVELVELPTPDETNDNIAAYWVPAKPPAPNSPLDLEYTQSWQMKDAAHAPTAQVLQSRWGTGYEHDPLNAMRYVIDFAGPALAAGAGITADVGVNEAGEVVQKELFRNEVTGGLRLSLRFRRKKEDQPLELRAQLRRDGKPVSETWSAVLPPE